MQLYAPAKINLSFEIKGRREDGFHEIETLDGADLAGGSPDDRTGRIHGRHPVFLRRFFAVERATIIWSSGPPSFSRRPRRSRAGVEIALEKKIPHGAGLGGGSSDAATHVAWVERTFRNASRSERSRSNSPLKLDRTFRFSFLVRRRSAGDAARLSSRPSLPASFNLLLVKPDFGVPTPWAYERWKDSRELPGVDYAAQNFSGVRFVNDLERPVFEKFVLLGYLKTWLRHQPEVGAALLSGSGSTVFAVLREGADAENLAARVREDIDPTLWTCHCETVDRALRAR